MQVIDDLGQVLLRFVLTCHILEMDALRRRYIDLGLIATAHTEHHGVPASFFHELPAHVLTDCKEDQQWQDPGHEEAHER